MKRINQPLDCCKREATWDIGALHPVRRAVGADEGSRSHPIPAIHACLDPITSYQSAFSNQQLPGSDLHPTPPITHPRTVKLLFSARTKRTDSTGGNRGNGEGEKGEIMGRIADLRFEFQMFQSWKICAGCENFEW